MKKLAIVGTHPSTRANAPFDNLDYEIWVFNEAAQDQSWCKRWDACFQLHKPEWYMRADNYSNNTHWEWLQQLHPGKVIWMQAIDDLVPASRAYPLEKIIATVPGGFRRVMGSSPAQAVALALCLGYKDIGVWGVELSSNTEYGRQLPSWMYWVGVADGMGVNLEIHSGQDHFKPNLYGWVGEVQLDKEYFLERAKMLEGVMSTAEKDMRAHRDRFDECSLKGDYRGSTNAIIAARDNAIGAGEIHGALEEARQYAARLSPIPRQEIERRAAQAQRDGEGFRAKMYHAGGRLELALAAWQATGKIERLQDVRALAGEQMKQASLLGQTLGMYKENLLYMQAIDDKAAGMDAVMEVGA
jgi:hypothetical protein